MQLGLRVSHPLHLPEKKGEFLGTLFPDGTIRYLTPSFFFLMKEGLRDWINRPFKDLIHPDSRANVEEAFQSVYDGDTVHLPYLCLQSKSGDLNFLDLTLTPSEVGREIQEILIFGKSTDGKILNPPDLSLAPIPTKSPGEVLSLWRGAEFSAAMTGFVEQILTKAPHGFCFFNRALRYVCVNESMADMYGFAPSRFLGRSPSEVFTFGSEIEHVLNEVILTQVPKLDLEIPFQVEGHDGSSLHSYYPISSKGEVIGVGCLISNITPRKKMERELSQALEELTRSNKDLEHFAYAASHDLKEPLRMVSMYIQLLERNLSGKLDKASQTYFQFVRDGSTRMNTLIEDLLKYSSLTRPAQSFVNESAEVLLERAIENLKVSIEETGAVVTHDALPLLPCDPIQIIQLFQNLIDNAIKYRSYRGPQVHISAQPVQNAWRFSVKDNGIGIDMRHSHQVFELFKRLHNNKAYAGTGIGLATCKRIVELHGGKIWVDSLPGEGSTFHFTLPFNQKY